MVVEDAWILDGNYSGTIDVRFSRADTAILLDLNRVRCVWRITRRTLGSLGKERVAEGCPDRFDMCKPSKNPEANAARRETARAR